MTGALKLVSQRPKVRNIPRFKPATLLPPREFFEAKPSQERVNIFMATGIWIVKKTLKTSFVSAKNAAL
jgi:hypothetical protein